MQYVSSAQRYAGEDHVILKARHAVYLAVQQHNPARWSENSQLDKRTPSDPQA